MAFRPRFPVFLALVACACGSSSSSKTSGGAMDASVDSSAAKPLAPTQLRAFESNAEGIGDACKSADYVKAQGILGEANTNWAALRPQIVTAGAGEALVKSFDDALVTLTKDIGASAQRACETDANAVTLAVPDLFDLFSFPVPSDALRGDGVFRALQIDGEYADFGAATRDLSATQSVWSRLEPLTAAQAPKRTDIAGASTVASDIGAEIQKCQNAIAAKDATALQTEAQNGLDLIDVVETIFK